MADRAKGKLAGAHKQLGVAPVVVIIPTCGEAGSIGRVIDALPAGWFERIIVATPSPSDYTADVARKFGATVVRSTGKAYGAACRAGIEFIADLDPVERPQAVAFIDPDYSANPAQLPLVVSPILKDECDVVIGSRMLKRHLPGVISPASAIGTKLACFAIGFLSSQRFSDIGTFRAVSWESLRQLHLSDAHQSWGAELQIKVSRMGFRIGEAAVDCRVKRNRSFFGQFQSGVKISLAIVRHGLLRR